jgi:iron-sulfur cluster assembly protein
MIQLTEQAVSKVREVIAAESGKFAGIRVAVVGGGCSGFQYSMNLESDEKQGDQIVELEGLRVFVDEQSMLYLDGTEIDYVETVQGAGFKFNNPNVTGSCGCGESLQF